MTTTKSPKSTAAVDRLRVEVAKAAAAHETARKAERAANRELKAAGRRLLLALAADLTDLTAAERRALGLPKGAR